jgi:hypothetical protein
MAHAGPRRSADDFGKKGLRRGVAMQDIVLAAFLVIDDELQSDARAIWPIGVRRRAAIADHVAWIGVVGHQMPLGCL